MINKLKSFINTEDKKRLLSNFISLAALQGANYILPLITLPYLVRVLGVEYFGLLAFATATITYFQIITDYGFNLTATREISIHRTDKEKVIEIFSSVMIIKFVLMIISFVLLCLLVFSFEKFRANYEVYFLTFGAVFGQVLFPVWFFQGMERMKYITYINIGSRLIFTISIFIFVHEQNHYYWVPILSALGSIVGGVYSLYLIFSSFKISFKLQKYTTLTYYLKQASYIFMSNVAISLYTVSTTFILGIFANNTIVGYFAAASKIVQAIRGLMTPVSQTIYPYIAKITNESKLKGLFFIRRIVSFIGIITLFMSVSILILAEPLVNLVLGAEYESSIIVLQLLSFTPFLIGLSNIFGVQTMLNFNRKKAFSKILITGSVLNIALSLILVPLFKHIGSAICVLIVETLITTMMLIYLQRSGLKLFGKIVPDTFDKTW